MTTSSVIPSSLHPFIPSFTSAPRRTATHRLRVAAGELLDEFAALVVGAGRDHDLELEVLVAAADALAAQTQPRTARCSRRDLHGEDGAVEGRHIDLAAQ